MDYHTVAAKAHNNEKKGSANTKICINKSIS